MTNNLTDPELKELDLAIGLLWNLLRDLKDIRQSGGPSDAELANAPLLDNWVPAKRLESCLSGNFDGHPIIRKGNFGITSQLWFVDSRFRFARTLSRYYRLGAPADLKDKRIH